MATKTKQLKLFRKFRTMRQLLRSAKQKGESIGYQKAFAELETREAKIKSEYQKMESRNQEIHKQQIDTMVNNHNTFVTQLSADHSKHIHQNNAEHENELKLVREQCALVCKRNDEMKTEEINRAMSIRENALKQEVYWNNRNQALQEFMASAMSTVTTISDRFSHVQNDISKVQVGKDMMKDLQDKFVKLNNYLNKKSVPEIDA